MEKKRVQTGKTEPSNQDFWNTGSFGDVAGIFQPLLTFFNITMMAPMARWPPMT